MSSGHAGQELPCQKIKPLSRSKINSPGQEWQWEGWEPQGKQHQEKFQGCCICTTPWNSPSYCPAQAPLKSTNTSCSTWEQLPAQGGATHTQHSPQWMSVLLIVLIFSLCGRVLHRRITSLKTSDSLSGSSC